MISELVWLLQGLLGGNENLKVNGGILILLLLGSSGSGAQGLNDATWDRTRDDDPNESLSLTL